MGGVVRSLKYSNPTVFTASLCLFLLSPPTGLVDGRRRWTKANWYACIMEARRGKIWLTWSKMKMCQQLLIVDGSFLSTTASVKFNVYLWCDTLRIAENIKANSFEDVTTRLHIYNLQILNERKTPRKQTISQYRNHMTNVINGHNFPPRALIVSRLTQNKSQRHPWPRCPSPAGSHSQSCITLCINLPTTSVC